MIRSKKVILILLLPFIALLHAGDTIQFPYTLTLKTEVPLISSITLLDIITNICYENQPAPTVSEIIALNSTDVNALDRTATDNWSEEADLGSDILHHTSRYSPFLLTIPLLLKKQWYPAVTLSLMYVEALSISGCLVSITKSLTSRPRPYMYGSALTVEQKEKKGKSGYRSFYSGHTSGAFCSAVFLSKVFSDMYPSSRFKGLMWGISMTAATTTGVLRYAAGKHFPTDILMGACMGSLAGYLIRVSHKKRETAAVVFYPFIGGCSGIGVTVHL